MGFPQHPRIAILSSIAALFFAASPALASEGHGGGHSLVLFPEWTELVPLIVLFLLLIPLVNTLLFKPVFRILDAREERIDGARRRATRLEHDAAAVVERYRLAVSEVRAEADAERKASLEAARRAQAERIAVERAEAERQLEASRRELDGALVGARESLRRDVEALAREAATRILGRSLS
jgi:F-type H+-transporting ATPase subunit b